MKFQIKNKWTGEIIAESETDTFKQFIKQNKTNLCEANLREADLREADLYGADLREADLYEANLRGANLREVRIKSYQQVNLIETIGLIVED